MWKLPSALPPILDVLLLSGGLQDRAAERHNRFELLRAGSSAWCQPTILLHVRGPGLRCRHLSALRLNWSPLTQLTVPELTTNSMPPPMKRSPAKTPGVTAGSVPTEVPSGYLTSS